MILIVMPEMKMSYLVINIMVMQSKGFNIVILIVRPETKYFTSIRLQTVGGNAKIICTINAI